MHLVLKSGSVAALFASVVAGSQAHAAVMQLTSLASLSLSDTTLVYPGKIDGSKISSPVTFTSGTNALTFSVSKDTVRARPGWLQLWPDGLRERHQNPVRRRLPGKRRSGHVAVRERRHRVRIQRQGVFSSADPVAFGRRQYSLANVDRAEIILNRWLLLTIAIVSEVVATSALKSSDGFTRLWPSLLVVGGYAIAFVCLSFTLRQIPIGITYAVWSGAGIVLISLVGLLLFKQKLDIPALLGMALIIAGIVVMHVFSINTAL